MRADRRPGETGNTFIIPLLLLIDHLGSQLRFDLRTQSDPDTIKYSKRNKTSTRGKLSAGTGRCIKNDKKMKPIFVRQDKNRAKRVCACARARVCVRVCVRIHIWNRFLDPPTLLLLDVLRVTAISVPRSVLRANGVIMAVAESH